MMRVVTAEEALSIIKSHDALVKNIATTNPSAEPDFDNHENHIGFFLRQLMDPKHFRPAKPLPANIDRTKIYNYETKSWETRSISVERGAEKDTDFSKKTSTTLLPKSGKMFFFGAQNGILFVFDLNKCKIKAKNIYNANMGTDNRPWLGGSGNPPALTTLDAIRAAQDEADSKNKVLYWNEILARIPLEALIAVAAPSDDATRRLNALYQKEIIKKYANTDLPIFIFTISDGIKIYTDQMCENDLKNPITSIQEEFAWTIINNGFKGFFPLIAEEKEKRRSLEVEEENTFLKLLRLEKLHVKFIKNASSPQDKQRFIDSFAFYFPEKNALINEKTALAQPINRSREEIPHLGRYIVEKKAFFEDISEDCIRLEYPNWKKYFVFYTMPNPFPILSLEDGDVQDDQILNILHSSYQQKSLRLSQLTVRIFSFMPLAIFIAYGFLAIAEFLGRPKCMDHHSCITDSEKVRVESYEAKINTLPYFALIPAISLLMCCITCLNCKIRTISIAEDKTTTRYLEPFVRFFQKKAKQEELAGIESEGAFSISVKTG